MASSLTGQRQFKKLSSSALKPFLRRCLANGSNLMFCSNCLYYCYSLTHPDFVQILPRNVEVGVGGPRRKIGQCAIGSGRAGAGGSPMRWSGWADQGRGFANCAGGSGRAKAKDLPMRWWEWPGRGEGFRPSAGHWSAPAETYFLVNFWCLPVDCQK